MKWNEDEKGKRWTSAQIPEGDFVARRVQRSFSPRKDGVWSYYAYRNGEVLAIRDSFEEARKVAEAGTKDKKQDHVLFYVRNHPDEVPPFLMLTEAERNALRAQYPYAAPSPKKIESYVKATKAKGGPEARDLNQPGVRAALAETPPADRPSPAQMRQQPVRKAVRAVAQEGIEPSANLSRLRAGNPKKAGSAAHKRWELLLKHADKGSTVKQFLGEHGNPETLANAVKAGYVAAK